MRAQLYFNDGTKDKASLAGLLFLFCGEVVDILRSVVAELCASPTVWNTRECFRQGDAGDFGRILIFGFLKVAFVKYFR